MSGLVPTPGSTAQPRASLPALEAVVARGLPTLLEELEHLVNIDCGSYTKDGVDRVGRWVAARMEGLGGSVTVHADATLGDTVVGTFEGLDPDGPTVLCIGHMDTVFDPGTVAARPFRIADGRATGPGVADMKGGLLAGLHAISAWHEVAGGLPLGRLVFVANPDEEIGSRVSTPHIVREAASADVALVLECARANGDIVSARKGTVAITVTVHGRAAHAGVEPEHGRNAIHEAARMIVDIQALHAMRPGITVNVGTVEGGTRSNVVPDTCRFRVDARAVTAADLEAIEGAIAAACEPRLVPDLRVERTVSGRHAPMELHARAEHLVDLAVGLAAQLGFPLRAASTGGASDANTTAGLGVPTLDGLGPVGGGDHAPGEYLEVASIVPRTTLLAALIGAVGSDPVVRAWRPR